MYFRLLLLCAFLFSSCKGNGKMMVYNVKGEITGEIRAQNPDVSTILDPYGQVIGRVEQQKVYTREREHIATLAQGEETISILQEDGREMGTLQNKTDCYDRDQNFLGRVSEHAPPLAAAGACAMLFLVEEHS